MNAEELLIKSYNKYRERLQEITDTFNYYFNEDNVDVQNIATLVDFKDDSGDCCIYEFIDDKDIPAEIADAYIDYTSDCEFNDNARILIPALHVRAATIYVRFPKVKITNEYNESTEIEDLFARVDIDYRGYLINGIEMIKTTFSEIHLINGYVHSHLPGVRHISSYGFRAPCLGTGPIINTIGELRCKYDTLEWELFCVELDKYVKVESVSGIPYIRMTAGTEGSILYAESESKRLGKILRIYKPWISYLLEHVKFDISYIKGAYRIADSYESFILKVSNNYIEYARSKGQSRDISLYECTFDGLHFYKKENENESSRVEELENLDPIFSFKGTPVKFKVNKRDNSNTTTIHLLGNSFLSSLLKYLNTYINFVIYGSNTRKDTQVAKGGWLL